MGDDGVSSPSIGTCCYGSRPANAQTFAVCLAQCFAGHPGIDCDQTLEGVHRYCQNNSVVTCRLRKLGNHGVQVNGYAKRFQVAGHGNPHGITEGLIEHVEQDALGRTTEVQMEHHQHFGGRHLILRIEERMRKHFEQHPASFFGKLHRIQVRGRTGGIHARIGFVTVVGQHFCRGVTVDA
jgi:hypothetical protein